MTELSAWITPLTLSTLVGGPAAPRIIDVRRRAAFDAGDCVIAGARWRDPSLVARWAAELDRGTEVVVYCVHGHQVSQAAASVLRGMGYRARCVEGGIEAFSACGGVTVARRPGLQDADQPSCWVTRERPGIDRLACTWLIRRFIDPCARILYVSPQQVAAVAEETAATAFDVEGVELNHDGDRCSFDALLRMFQIEDPAVAHLARIVRGADTARLDLEAECAGLLALSLGISSLHADDLLAMQHGFALYDALYAWARGSRVGSLAPGSGQRPQAH